MLPSTHFSMLEALKDSGSLDEYWPRFSARYYPAILALCQSRGLQVADAEDLAQEVLLKWREAMPKFDANRQFRPWFSTLVLNAIRDFKRRQERRPDVAVGADSGERLADSLKAASEIAARVEELFNSDQESALARAKREASPHNWQFFDFVYLQGNSPESAAEKFNTTVNAVYMAVGRVANLLHKYYRNSPAGE